MRLAVIAIVVLGCATASADDEPANPKAVRRHDATFEQIFEGPFASSHLFAMPTASVVGPYQLSVAGEGSLLSETGAFSGSGVVAVGFGDVAQLEFRLAAAVSTLQASPVPLPTAGAQFKLPLRERKYVPAFAAAVRIGLPRDESANGTTYRETVTDIYAVTSLHLWGPFRRFTLHAGLRFGFASIEERDTGTKKVSQTLYLPAGGWDVQMTPRTRLVGELALVPVFSPAMGASTIGTQPFGRVGVRWFILPFVVIDASVGYGIEVAKLNRADLAGSLNALVDWDLRLGLEIFVPWGALICRLGNVFCE